MSNPEKLSDIIVPVIEELVRLNEITAEHTKRWKELKEQLRKDSELLDARSKELDAAISDSVRRIRRDDE